MLPLTDARNRIQVGGTDRLALSEDALKQKLMTLQLIAHNPLETRDVFVHLRRWTLCGAIASHGSVPVMPGRWNFLGE